MATTGSLLANQRNPSPVAGKNPKNGSSGIKLSVHVPPPSLEYANLVVLKPRTLEKSLTAVTRFAGFRGSTAMCSSASGSVVVGITVGPTPEGLPLRSEE